MVEELVHENVQGSTQRVKGVVPDVLREDEGRKSDRHCEMRKFGLDEGSVRVCSIQRLSPRALSPL